MIGIDDIQDIVQVAVWTGALKDENPLSIVLLSKYGSGKSTVIRKTYKPPPPPKRVETGFGKDKKVIYVRQVSGTVLYTTNTTPYYLYTRFGELLKSGQVRHIAMPDFLNLLNQQKHILQAHLTFYNSLIEEGILAIESKEGQFVADFPVKIGLITAIAKKDYLNRLNIWTGIGFRTRILPISYRYTADTQQKIRDSAKNKDYLKEESFDITLPPETTIELPRGMADEIEQIALVVKDRDDEVGVRRQKQLQTFCMANALRDGRDKVDWDDIGKLKRYEKYLNTSCSAEL